MTTTEFAATISGQKATFIVDNATARVEQAGRPAKFVPLAVPSTFATIDGNDVLVPAGDVIVRTTMTAGATLARRFDLRLFEKGELVEVMPAGAEC